MSYPRVPQVVLAWVLARPEMVDRLLAGLEGGYDRSVLLYLTASPEALKERLERQPDRTAPLDYALGKLRAIEALPHPRIDTTGLGSEEVAERIISEIRSR